MSDQLKVNINAALAVACAGAICTALFSWATIVTKLDIVITENREMKVELRQLHDRMNRVEEQVNSLRSKQAVKVTTADMSRDYTSLKGD